MLDAEEEKGRPLKAVVGLRDENVTKEEGEAFSTEVESFTDEHKVAYGIKY